MSDTYTDADDIETCEGCEEPGYGCTCACPDCGDTPDECACEDCEDDDPTDEKHHLNAGVDD